MSNITYKELWAEAQSALNDILQEDGPEPIPAGMEDKTLGFYVMANMYVKYVQIIRRLEECYDQTVHPQKREIQRTLLDSTIGRLLELKQDLVNLELSEYHFFDDILADMKLTPEDMEIPIPKYFLLERGTDLKDREEAFDAIMEQIRAFPSSEAEGEGEVTIEAETETAVQESSSPSALPFTQPQSTIDLIEAIQLIQVHERARQGRLKLIILKKLLQKDSRPPPKLQRAEAAIIIQKMWRGYMVRKSTEKCREEELMFLGMMHVPLPADDENNLMNIRKKSEDLKRSKQKVHETLYKEAIVRAREKLVENESTMMEEEMKDKIRSWVLEVMVALDKVPDYPLPEEGGSLLILEDKLTIEEMERREKEAATGKPAPKEKPKPGGKKEESGGGIVMIQSKFLPSLTECNTDYDKMWQDKDEIKNIEQRHDEEMLLDMKRAEIKEELRASVDEIMMLEFDRLQLAYCRDRGIKPPKKKAPKKVKAKGKKKEKDLTADRTLESLYEELVVNGIVRKYNKTHMKDFIGSYSYLGCLFRSRNEADQPSLCDVRNLVTQYCILPLGSPAVHMNSPLIKAVLLVGPPGSGKTMLIDVICTESGANLFDLSPETIAGKYPGKDGLKMLLHMVKKVGVLLQPSVILIENADMAFAKKIPKEMKALDPKRLKGVLPKYVKSFLPEEQILLIGTASSAYGSDAKGIGKLYQKIIMIPIPNYATRFTAWNTFLEREMAGGKTLTGIDTATLATISDKFTIGSIHKACKQVLTDYRKARRHGKHIRTEEFVIPLAKIGPMFEEEESAYKMWYFKTPLGKKWSSDE